MLRGKLINYGGKNEKLSSVFLVLFLVLLLGLVLGSGSFAAEAVKYTEQAEALKSLGLFNGTNVGFELERAPKRVEVAAMLVKFLGAEEEAKAKQYKHPFTDVPSWANHIVGYMYEKKLTTGIGNNLFGSLNPASAKDYTVFLLKALGYGSSDFTYHETMNFAVSKGLYTAAEKATLESSTFKRDEMVFLSYKSLFTKIKGSTQLLSEKLGISSVPKITAPVSVTVQRVMHDANGAVRFIIDRTKLPEPFKNFVYIGVSGVYWTTPTTMAQINTLIPSGKNEAEYLYPYEIDGLDAYGAYWNTVVSLYDADKRLIGYFDILGNNMIGTFTVNIRPVTTVQEVAEIKTGVTVGANGMITINRNGLPASAKLYAKVAVAEKPLSTVSAIISHSDEIIGKSTTKFYTTATVDGVTACKYLSDKATLLFYDEDNKLIGYANVDAAPIISAMKNYLESKGVKEITKGVVIAAYEDAVYANINKSEIDYSNSQNLKSYGVGIVQSGLSVVAIVKDSLNETSPYRVPVSAGGVSTGRVLNNDNVLVTYYDANNALVAYSVCAYSEINKRTDSIKQVEVIFDSKIGNDFSNSFFTIEFYKNGSLVGSQGVRYFDLIHNEKGEWIGVSFKPIIIDPNEGYEIKVKSNNPSFIIKGTQVK